MQRARLSSSWSSGQGNSISERDVRSRRRKAALALAAAVAGSLVSRANAATDTWTGAIADPNSATYTTIVPIFTSGQNLYIWNTAIVNWNNGGTNTYAVGDNVVFNDGFG